MAAWARFYFSVNTRACFALVRGWSSVPPCFSPWSDLARSASTDRGDLSRRVGFTSGEWNGSIHRWKRWNERREISPWWKSGKMLKEMEFRTCRVQSLNWATMCHEMEIPCIIIFVPVSLGNLFCICMQPLWYRDIALFIYFFVKMSN